MAEADPGGTLYVVATPIGNLGDITLRALEVLKGAAVVAAEDTRLTLRLWARHGITTHLVSYHAQSAPAREAELLARLAAGEDVALVTDAGTPLVSDPGEGLVGAWAARGGRVVPIPGPSAVLAALVASAIPAPRWAFEGFLPRKGGERRARLARIAADDRATVLFEAPGRTAATLRDLAATCGPERAAAVCRELTKRHEEVLRGGLGELAARLAAGEGVRGEVTIVVAGASGGAHPGPGDASTAVAAPGDAGTLGADAPDPLATGRARVAALVAAGLPRAAAARQVARETGLSRRALYEHEEDR
ncbi:MAG: 16S rRNA (cytidine(1402)-2'-O)-methyltransferase [Chloroflexota bacterium]